MGIPLFTASVIRGDNSSYCLFASLEDKAFLKRGLLLEKKSLLRTGANSFLYEQGVKNT